MNITGIVIVPSFTTSQTTLGEPYTRESHHLTFIARKPQMAKKQAPFRSTSTHGLSALNIGFFAIYLTINLLTQNPIRECISIKNLH